MNRKLETLLRKRLAGKDAQDPDARQAVYVEVARHIRESAQRQGLDHTHSSVQQALDALLRAAAAVEEDFSGKLAKATASPAIANDGEHRLRRMPVQSRSRLLRIGGLAAVVLFAGAAGTLLFDSGPSGPLPAAAKLSTPDAAGNGAGGVAPGAVFSALPGDQKLFRAQDGNTLERAGDLLRMASTVADPAAGGATGGVFVIVPEDIEQRVGGKTITVTVRARAAAGNPSPSFAVAYSTAAVGTSGWRVFAVKEALGTHRFTYRVPPSEGCAGAGFHRHLGRHGRKRTLHRSRGRRGQHHGGALRGVRTGRGGAHTGVAAILKALDYSRLIAYVFSAGSENQTEPAEHAGYRFA